MVGNRFAADNLAKEFDKRMKALKSIKKQASDQSESEVNPEDFLVLPTESVDTHSNDLNDKIEQVSSYAKDSSCEKCAGAECTCAPQENEAKDAACEGCGKSECDCGSDMSYLLDPKGAHILSELGKISKGLREKNQDFAADVVEATALSIKDDLVKEATLKLEVISGLQKLARAAHKKGDIFAGDMIYATINEIKDAQ